MEKHSCLFRPKNKWGVVEWQCGCGMYLGGEDTNEVANRAIEHYWKAIAIASGEITVCKTCQEIECECGRA